MKDGIYRVTANVGGRSIAAEAQVRNGVFQGLGALAGMVGVFDFDVGTAGSNAPGAGASRDIQWRRADLVVGDASCPITMAATPSTALLAIDDALRDVRRQLDALRALADQQRALADRFRADVDATWSAFNGALGCTGPHHLERDPARDTGSGTAA